MFILRDLLIMIFLLIVFNIIVNYDITITKKNTNFNEIDLDDDYKSLNKMFKYSMEKKDMFNMIIKSRNTRFQHYNCYIQPRKNIRRPATVAPANPYTPITDKICDYITKINNKLRVINNDLYYKSDNEVLHKLKWTEDYIWFPPGSVYGEINDVNYIINIIYNMWLMKNGKLEEIRANSDNIPMLLSYYNYYN